MDIILAVDIMEGKVVKAYAGMRLNYKPLVIEKTDFSNPIFLIKQIVLLILKNIKDGFQLHSLKIYLIKLHKIKRVNRKYSDNYKISNK